MTTKSPSIALFLPILILLALPVQAQETERGDVLIQNATVITVTNGTLDDTDILVRDGKIAEIGQDLSAPSGVEAIDATGKYVMPGIVDAHSHIAISNVNDSSSPVTAQISVGDVLAAASSLLDAPTG